MAIVKDLFHFIFSFGCQLFCEPAPEGHIAYFAPFIPTFEALKQISQTSPIFRRVVPTCFLDFLKLFPSIFTFSSQFLAHFFLISYIFTRSITFSLTSVYRTLGYTGKLLRTLSWWLNSTILLFSLQKLPTAILEGT